MPLDALVGPLLNFKGGNSILDILSVVHTKEREPDISRFGCRNTIAFPMNWKSFAI